MTEAEEIKASRKAFTRTDYREAGVVGGVCEVEFDPVPAGWQVFLERLSIVTNSATITEAIVYDGAVDDNRVLDGSSTGDFDVLDANRPVLVTGSVLVRWTNVSAGAVAHARAQFRYEPV